MDVERDLERIGPILAPAILALFVVIGAATRTPGDPALAVPAAAVGFAAALGLLLAAGSPVAFGALLALATAAVAVVAGGSAANVAYFAMCDLAAWAMVAGGPRIGVAYLLAGSAMFGGQALWGSHDPGWGAWTGGLCASSLSSWLGAHERKLLLALRDAQAGLAERSAAEERNRISRELHDVIAHSLTVSLLHVSSARLSVQHDDPADAVRALAEAERLGRESLDEVRSIVGLLRSDEHAARGAPAPVPGAAALPELVERYRAAGAAITFDDDGRLTALPATAGATAYRILQEALTNAAKHAPGEPVSVSAAVRDGRFELRVESAGLPGPAGSRGTGLHSMRERAQALGGGCDAGPADGGGWRVRAWLPCGGALS